ncbi:MAG: TetR/AcrR family transcriptional regulator [Pseudomonadota bacterium]
MARRSKEDAEKTRSELVRVARELFEAQGFKETTVAQIVERAGITKGGLFHYFKTKDDVFREIWSGLQAEMDAEARENAIAARSRTDPYAAFLAGCRTYLHWAARPDYQQIVLIDGPSVLGLAGWYEADNDLGRRNVSAGIEYLARKGIVAEHRVQALSVLVHNALNGAGFAMARGEPGVTVDSVLDAFEAVLKSLR